MRVRIACPSRATTVRAFEGFAITFLSALLSQVSIAGHPINLASGDSQSAILTAALAGLGVAARRSVASP